MHVKMFDIKNEGIFVPFPLKLGAGYALQIAINSQTFSFKANYSLAAPRLAKTRLGLG